MSNVRAHVAVVEDDAPVRRALVRVLVAAGFKVSGYASAEEFLALGGDPSPDCVLLDIHLPQMGGIELHNRLRRAKGPIPIVLITADHELARSEMIRHIGTPCLTKPIDEHTLLDAISRVTEHVSHDDA